MERKKAGVFEHLNDFRPFKDNQGFFCSKLFETSKIDNEIETKRRFLRSKMAKLWPSRKPYFTT